MVIAGGECVPLWGLKHMYRNGCTEQPAKDLLQPTNVLQQQRDDSAGAATACANEHSIESRLRPAEWAALKRAGKRSAAGRLRVAAFWLFVQEFLETSLELAEVSAGFSISSGWRECGAQTRTHL